MVRNTDLLIEASSPSAWLDVHLTRRFQHAEATASDDIGWLRYGQLLAGPDGVLRAAYRGLLAERYPPASAATFVAFYTAGTLADAVGFVHIGTGAGVELDTASVRWHRHAAGYVDRVEIGTPTFLVAADHPWACAGDPCVEIVEDESARRVRTLQSLVAAVRPIIDACHELTRVGKAGLWNEVVDGLGFCLSWQDVVPADLAALHALTTVILEPAMPWKARPTMEIIDVGGRPAIVGQKGGCCLAYTRLDLDDDRDTATDEDEDERSYHERFPTMKGEPLYCSTCSLRDLDDCVARQTFFLARDQATSLAGEPQHREPQHEERTT